MSEQTDQSAELLIVALPGRLESGSMLQVLGVASSLAEAERQVQDMDVSVLGRVAVLEKRKLFHRRHSVVSVEVDEPIVK